MAYEAPYYLDKFSFFRVSNNKVTSKTYKTNIGIPKVSVLGTIIRLIFINDLFIPDSFTNQLAVDISTVVTTNNYEILFVKMKAAMESMTCWC